ncbi:MAG: GDP-mannose 4,6-dehydratase [Actinobacteria bacterium]|nr:GDP-mannose 4,6-dehydratase [Chloroflexota bacterium]MBE3128749.1 GDP-mannose 4,6-dehydratase [Actinomycetota bacterium]
MSEKFAVIGSNSFSGSNFVDYLLNNNIEVIGISRSAEPEPVFLPYKKNDNISLFKFYQLDLNKDLKKIVNLINEIKPNYVVNFAAQGMVAESWNYPEHWFRTNTLSSVMLHDQLRKCSFLKKYVHVSTPEVYGSCKGLVKENTIYNPSTPYAVSRAAADMSLMSFYKNYGFPVVFTRSANVFGPCQQLYRIIPRTILFFLLKKKLQLHGGGHSVRSFIHIKDVAEGTLGVARLANPPEIFHFSTSNNISIRTLVEMIAKQLNISFEDYVEIVDERSGKDVAYLLDNAKAKEILGWRDKITLEQGIEGTIKWIRDNLEILKKQDFDYIHKV